MKTIPSMALAVAVSLLATPALAADGRQVFEDRGCTACHGEDAKTPLEPGYPRLAGQNADYAFNQMMDIKGGKRVNGLTADTMAPILEDMNEAEIRAVADYLFSLGPIAGKGEAGDGKKLYMTKTCVACHGKDGTKPIMKNYPYIAGQEKQYLVTQMHDIKSGARANGNANAMQAVMHLVTDDEIAAVAEFLANVK